MQINSAHWHLLLNHFPIILSITGTGFLLLSFFVKNNGFRNASLGIMIVAALFAIPAYYTGEGAEEIAEETTGVSELYLEKHEDIASVAFNSILITGALALLTIAIIKWKSKHTIMMFVITSVASLTSAGMLGYTGFTGGKIMHAEIRTDTENAHNKMEDNISGASEMEEEEE